MRNRTFGRLPPAGLWAPALAAPASAAAAGPRVFRKSLLPAFSICVAFFRADRKLTRTVSERAVSELRAICGSMRPARVLVCALAIAASLAADEGMWTFDNLPLRQLQGKYGFTPSKQWLEHVRLSSVRFSDGGSGSFISSEGLILTNHHVALEQLQKNSSAAHDYPRDGFYASTRD